MTDNHPSQLIFFMTKKNKNQKGKKAAKKSARPKTLPKNRLTQATSLSKAAPFSSRSKSEREGNPAGRQKSLIAMAIFLFLILLAFLANGGYITSSFANILADQQSSNNLFIDPDFAAIKIAESHVFTSYIKTDTANIPVNADWSFEPESKDETGARTSDVIVKGDSNTDTPLLLAMSSVNLESNSILDSAVNSKTGANDFLQITDQNGKVYNVKKPANYTSIDYYTVKSESAPGLSLECKSVGKCQVYAKNKPGKYRIKASFGDQTASAVLVVDPTTKKSPFSDQLPSWGEKVILAMHEKGIIKGYENGRYGSEDPVTRAQLTMLIYKIGQKFLPLDMILADKNCDLYSDVKDDHFAYRQICLGHYSGWFKNLPLTGNKFAPNSPLNRKEVASLIANSGGLNLLRYKMQSEKNDFSSQFEQEIAAHLETMKNLVLDGEKIEASAMDDIATVMALGIMRGKSEFYENLTVYRFRPQDLINRAEIAVALWNFLLDLDNYAASEKLDSSNELKVFNY